MRIRLLGVASRFIFLGSIRIPLTALCSVVGVLHIRRPLCAMLAQLSLTLLSLLLTRPERDRIVDRTLLGRSLALGLLVSKRIHHLLLLLKLGFDEVKVVFLL